LGNFWETITSLDLTKCGQQLAQRIATECGTPLRWFDLYGKQAHLREFYPSMKVSAYANSLKYGSIIRKHDQPGYVLTQWFENGGSLPLTAQFKKSKTVTDSFTWSVTEALKIGVEVKVGVNIPAIVDGNVQIKTELNLEANQEKTTTETEEFTVSHEIVIPARTKVKATMTITDTKIEVPWAATMYVHGYEAMWFEKKCRNHWLWFYRVNFLADCSPKLRAVMTPFGWGLRYNVKGSFESVKAVRATVHTSEEPMTRSEIDDWLRKENMRT